MGGRGASSGVSVKRKPYGSEYTTLYQSGNIKFVQANFGAQTAPLETMTRGRIYVTVSDDGESLKSVSYYDRNNKRFKQIDLDHYHKINGKPEKPHTQYGYYHDGAAYVPSDSENRLLDKVEKAWYNRHSKS